MPHFLSHEELQRTAPAETATFASPVPTQVVSNGEYIPLPQTARAGAVGARDPALADRLAPAPRHGSAPRSWPARAAAWPRRSSP